VPVTSAIRKKKRLRKAFTCTTAPFYVKTQSKIPQKHRREKGEKTKRARGSSVAPRPSKRRTTNSG
jgi:hypothetical protein